MLVVLIWIIALVLAIPTYGISIVVAIFINIAKIRILGKIFLTAGCAFGAFIGLIIALCAARDKSVKNWAAAQLIVSIVVSVLLGSILAALGASLYDVLSSL